MPDFTSFLAETPTLDLIAAIWFLIAIVGYRLLTAYRPFHRRSLMAAIQTQRVRWMHNMSERDNRAIDAILLSNLSTGNTFFASTSVIAVGGLATLLGASDDAREMLERIPIVVKSAPLIWEIKLLLMMLLFIYAFFKFAWAFRLTHYTAIMIGAMPNSLASAARLMLAAETKSEADGREFVRLHAERTARVAGIAAEHANQGLRTYYFAISVLGWFVHPLALIVVTSAVVTILYRREFLSRALQAVDERWPAPQ